MQADPIQTTRTVGVLYVTQKGPVKTRHRRCNHRRVRPGRSDLPAGFHRKPHIATSVHRIAKVMVRFVPDFPDHVRTIMFGGFPYKSHIARPCRSLDWRLVGSAIGDRMVEQPFCIQWIRVIEDQQRNQVVRAQVGNKAVIGVASRNVLLSSRSAPTAGHYEQDGNPARAIAAISLRLCGVELILTPRPPLNDPDSTKRSSRLAAAFAWLVPIPNAAVKVSNASIPMRKLLCIRLDSQKMPKR